MPWNLLALGSTPRFECQCHRSSHDGNEPTYETLAGIIAKRERLTVDDIERSIMLLRRLPKRPTRREVERGLDELDCGARTLCEGVLKEMGVLD